MAIQCRQCRETACMEFCVFKGRPYLWPFLLVQDRVCFRKISRRMSESTSDVTVTMPHLRRR
jgi:hypothetical protein